MFPFLAILVFFALILTHPSVCIQSAAAGLALWYQQLVPTLFPSMILASLLVTRKFFSKVEAALPVSLIPVAAGCLCGSPMGAKLSYDLYRRGSISLRRAKQLLCLTQIPSPMFLFGYVAIGCLGLPSAAAFGLALYLPIALIGACIWATERFLQRKPRKTGSSEPRKRTADTQRNSPATKAGTTVPSQPDFSEVAGSCLAILIKIGVLIMFFFILGGLLDSIFMPSLWLDLIRGCLEMTSGIDAVSSYVMPLREKTMLTLFLISFGGVSIHMQVMQTWEGLPFPRWQYLLLRIFCGLLSAALYWLLTLF